MSDDDLATPIPVICGEPQEDASAVLTTLRDSIDNLDAAIIHIFAERFKLTQSVGILKRDHNLPSADPAREQRQIARLLKMAEEAGLDPEFTTELMRFIISHVIRRHEALRASGAEDG